MSLKTRKPYGHGYAALCLPSLCWNIVVARARDPAVYACVSRDAFQPVWGQVLKHQVVLSSVYDDTYNAVVQTERFTYPFRQVTAFKMGARSAWVSLITLALWQCANAVP